ncbi:hypothetical protein EHO58_19430 [Leptospira selangorensis]|uniref:hypothetical protein n=1 Tax=Leptospira selangorensis TaxID=2484982 RepID=UPI00108238AC|nr:hypothetical protein [Leptospira selangorensis]TGJ99807.1 hypothetical protein EHO58_19430 [Leptospira selangorensis]
MVVILFSVLVIAGLFLSNYTFRFLDEMAVCILGRDVNYFFAAFIDGPLVVFLPTYLMSILILCFEFSRWKFKGKMKMTTENLYILKGVNANKDSFVESSELIQISLFIVVCYTFLYIFTLGAGTIIRNERIQDYSFYIVSTEEALSDITYAKFEKKSGRGSLNRVILTFRDSKEIKIYYNIQLLFEILDKYHVVIEGR